MLPTSTFMLVLLWAHGKSWSRRNRNETFLVQIYFNRTRKGMPRLCFAAMSYKTALCFIYTRHTIDATQNESFAYSEENSVCPAKRFAFYKVLVSSS